MKNHPLIVSLLPLAVAWAIACGTSSTRAAESDPQEAAITTMAEAFVEAFQKGDAKAVAAFWTLDGDYVDLTGRVFNGRPAIEKDFDNLFAENKGLKLRIEIASLKFPTLTCRRGWDHGRPRSRWDGPEPSPL
jgi:Nuclear transport factor 2 (NTF2) domain